MDDDRPKKLSQAKLESLRKTVPHATLDSIGAEVKEGADPNVIEDLTAYLHHFAAPNGEGHPCLRCGEPLVQSMVQQLMGTRGGFEWGLAHGHGHCRCCGWPATLYHFIKDRHGKDLMTIRNILLQVHPDDIELSATKARAA